MRPIILSAIIFIASTCSVFGQSLPSYMPRSGQALSSMNSFDQKLVNFMRRDAIAGGVVAIVKNYKLYYLRGYGYSDLSHKTPMNVDTMFRVASVSKSLTAIGIMKLVDQGKLKLSDRVYPLLDLKPFDGKKLNPRVNRITIKNLLQMRAGWPRWLDPLFGPWPKSYLTVAGRPLNIPLNCEQAARYMMSVPLSANPGSRYQYANINYCLLGLVISKLHDNRVDEKQYVDYMQQNIFHPLGRYSMHIAETRKGLQNKLEPTYYPIAPPPSPHAKNVVVIDSLPYGNDNILQNNAANGGWVASAYDLVKLVNRLQLGQILSQKSLNQMFALPPSQSWGYGLGWFLLRRGKDLYWYGHGSFTGTNTIILRKKNGTILVALFNKKPASSAKLTRFRENMISLFDTI